MEQNVLKISLPHLVKNESIEIDAEETEAMKLMFPLALQPGKMIFETKCLAKSYGDKKVINEIKKYLILTPPNQRIINPLDAIKIDVPRSG